jgi:cell division septation protein DedD
MGDLARQRNARDLWVSRGHLWAMGAGTFVLAATAFAVGFTVGREHAPAVEEIRVATNDEDLVALLARVEASAQPHGGVDALTFPDALEGHSPGLPAVLAHDAAPLPSAPFVIGGSPVRPTGDPVPAGQFTVDLVTLPDAAAATAVRDRLRKAGFPAWIGLVVEDGHPLHHVAIGGYGDEAEAAGAMAGIVPKLGALGVESAPTVRALE